MNLTHTDAIGRNDSRPANFKLFLLAIAVLFVVIAPRAASATTFTVNSGGDLQSALNSAQPGDEVLVEAGATFVGNFNLPAKSGSDYITVRSSRCWELPWWSRVTTSNTSQLATIATPNSAPVFTAPINSHHWRLQCLEITQSPSSTFTYDLVALGDGDGAGPQTSLSVVPHHFDIDRCIIRARDSQTPVKRGVALNSAYTSVRHSRISDIKVVGQDTQAVGGWNGPGPFLIDNNFLEASGENIIFGGSPPAIPGLVPSDIVIRRNHLFKPLAWRTASWSIKNLLELKSARRIRIEGNILENNWADAQTGWAVIFNVFGDDSSPDRVEDVDFVFNMILNSDNGINLRGQDNERTQTAMRRVRIAHNLLKNLKAFGGEGKTFQLLESSESVSFDHNTVTGTVSSFVILSTYSNFKHVGCSFTNNLAPGGDYAVFSDGGNFGYNALNERCGTGNWTFARNLIGIDNPQWFFFPSDNYIVSAAAYPNQFVNFAGGDYHVSSTSCGSMASGCSPKGGTDQRDVGADIDILATATSGCVSGSWYPNPIDDSRFFVRQHYVDFLGREPDGGGLNWWAADIDVCGSDASCREVKRINVSAAFFLSIESQQTGYLAYRAWGAAFGPTRIEGQRALTRDEFLPDMRILNQNLVVGATGWEAQLEANKVTYFNAFVARPAFTSAYPTSLTPTQYVDALNTSSGFVLSLAERNQLISDLSGGAKTRAEVLRAVAEDSDFTYGQTNRAFVTMEYFGYLLRDPDSGGFAYWLDKLNQFGGNYIDAEMVKGFITSIEYRSRFGQP